LDPVEMMERILKLEAGHKRVSDAVDYNTAMTKQVHDNTKELLELFAAAKGGFKTALWLGRAVRWTAGIVASLVGGYIAVKTFLGGG
jgi:hypothetical protein